MWWHESRAKWECESAGVYAIQATRQGLHDKIACIIYIAQVISIGVIITILSLAVDPFVQQVIGQGQMKKLNIATTIPRATRYAKGA